ncbi:unnamed protein product [Amoebophrya sp. A120]|nr:unnamed protein product [Amoebophrya sp. A120]|eukprot:GSA120T00011180001.1
MLFEQASPPDGEKNSTPKGRRTSSGGKIGKKADLLLEDEDAATAARSTFPGMGTSSATSKAKTSSKALVSTSTNTTSTLTISNQQHPPLPQSDQEAIVDLAFLLVNIFRELRPGPWHIKGALRIPACVLAASQLRFGRTFLSRAKMMQYAQLGYSTFSSQWQAVKQMLFTVSAPLAWQQMVYKKKTKKTYDCFPSVAMFSIKHFGRLLQFHRRVARSHNLPLDVIPWRERSGKKDPFNNNPRVAVLKDGTAVEMPKKKRGAVQPAVLPVGQVCVKTIAAALLDVADKNQDAQRQFYVEELIREQKVQAEKRKHAQIQAFWQKAVGEYGIVDVSEDESSSCSSSSSTSNSEDELESEKDEMDDEYETAKRRKKDYASKRGHKKNNYNTGRQSATASSTSPGWKKQKKLSGNQNDQKKKDAKRAEKKQLDLGLDLVMHTSDEDIMGDSESEEGKPAPPKMPVEAAKRNKRRSENTGWGSKTLREDSDKRKNDDALGEQDVVDGEVFQHATSLFAVKVDNLLHRLKERRKKECGMFLTRFNKNRGQEQVEKPQIEGSSIQTATKQPLSTSSSSVRVRTGSPSISHHKSNSVLPSTASHREPGFLSMIQQSSSSGPRGPLQDYDQAPDEMNAGNLLHREVPQSTSRSSFGVARQFEINDLQRQNKPVADPLLESFGCPPFLRRNFERQANVETNTTFVPTTSAARGSSSSSSKAPTCFSERGTLPVMEVGEGRNRQHLISSKMPSLVDMDSDSDFAACEGKKLDAQAPLSSSRVGSSSSSSSSRPPAPPFPTVQLSSKTRTEEQVALWRARNLNLLTPDMEMAMVMDAVYCRLRRSVSSFFDPFHGAVSVTKQKIVPQEVDRSAGGPSDSADCQPSNSAAAGGARTLNKEPFLNNKMVAKSASTTTRLFSDAEQKRPQMTLSSSTSVTNAKATLFLENDNDKELLRNVINEMKTGEELLASATRKTKRRRGPNRKCDDGGVETESGDEEGRTSTSVGDVGKNKRENKLRPLPRSSKSFLKNKANKVGTSSSCSSSAASAKAVLKPRKSLPTSSAKGRPKAKHDSSGFSSSKDGNKGRKTTTSTKGIKLPLATAGNAKPKSATAASTVTKKDKAVKKTTSKKAVPKAKHKARKSLAKSKKK